jgi:hypothetical protein
MELYIFLAQNSWNCDLPINNTCRRVPTVAFDNSVMVTGGRGASCCVLAYGRCDSHIRFVEILFVGCWLRIQPCHSVHWFLASVTMWMAPWGTSCCSSIIAAARSHFVFFQNGSKFYSPLSLTALRLWVSATNGHDTMHNTAFETCSWAISGARVWRIAKHFVTLKHFTCLTWVSSVTTRREGAPVQITEARRSGRGPAVQLLHVF